MTGKSEFDSIRAYSDEEVPGILKTLSNEPNFIKALQMFLPDKEEKDLKSIFQNIESIKDFQSLLVSPVMSKITEDTTDGFTYSGIENLDKNQGYLFISNHRDIALDSALINYALHLEGLDTFYIAIGSNLLDLDWVRHLVRINKSFIVRRNVPIQEMYKASQNLSAYIHMLRAEKEVSVWIAQREGRAKDGNDKTQPGLLKMLTLNKGRQDITGFFKKLNIVPIAISYEKDPCDVLKIPSLAAERQGESYNKQKGEDEQNMLQGITGQKGKVNISFGKPLDSELDEMDSFKRPNDKINCLARLLDSKIHSLYKNHKTNYMAYDILYKTEKYRKQYTPEQLQEFNQYILRKGEEMKGVDVVTVKELLLEMYAKSVKNKEPVED